MNCLSSPYDFSEKDPALLDFKTELVADRLDSRRPTAYRAIGKYVTMDIIGLYSHLTGRLKYHLDGPNRNTLYFSEIGATNRQIVNQVP